MADAELGACRLADSQWRTAPPCGCSPKPGPSGDRRRPRRAGPAHSAPSVIAAVAADLGGKNPVVMTLLSDFGRGDGRAVAADRTARCSLVQNSVAIRAASTGNQHGAGRIIRGPRHKYRPDAIDKLEFNHPIIGDILEPDDDQSRGAALIALAFDRWRLDRARPGRKKKPHRETRQMFRFTPCRLTKLLSLVLSRRWAGGGKGAKGSCDWLQRNQVFPAARL
jgi:hypothetical protein